MGVFALVIGVDGLGVQWRRKGPKLPLPLIVADNHFNLLSPLVSPRHLQLEQFLLFSVMASFLFNFL